MTFSTLSSTGSTADGIRLDNTAGAFTGMGGTVSSAAQEAVDISGNGTNDTVDFTYDGTISDTSGRLVSISNQSGGTKDFNGPISDTGGFLNTTGITVSNNAGATTRFDGRLSVSTFANNALTLSGGGDVFVTHADSTITTTTGTGVDVSFGSGTVDVGAAITSGTGSPVRVTFRTGGSVTFSDTIQDGPAGGAGIAITNNTGTAIRFSGATQEIDTSTAAAVTILSNAAGRSASTAVSWISALRELALFA